MNSKTIASKWDEFKATHIHPDTPEPMVKDFMNTFYAGATGVLVLIRNETTPASTEIIIDQLVMESHYYA